MMTCTRDFRYVRVDPGDVGPVHSLQRFALYSAVTCAKLHERVPTARMNRIHQLVHAIASLQAW